jgi:LEA14-like dessication related protein
LKLRAETIFVLFIAATVILLSGAYLARPPASSQVTPDALTISHVSVVDIQSVSLSSANLLVRFEIDNPTPVSTTLENASYFLYGNGNYLGYGAITQQVKIPAGNSTYVESSFKTGLTDSARVFFSYLFSNSNSIAWEAKGNATFSEPLIGLVVVHFDSS